MKGFIGQLPASPMRVKKLPLAVMATLALGAFGSVEAQTAYTVHDLGTLGGTISIAYGINSYGQVVGLADIPGNTAYHPFRTAAKTPINPLIDDSARWGEQSAVLMASTTSVRWSDGPIFPETWTFTPSAQRRIAQLGYQAMTWELWADRMATGYGVNSSGQVVGWAYI